MDILSLQFLLTFLLIFFSLHFFHILSKKLTNQVGFKLYPIIGVLPDFLNNRHRILEWITEVLASCPTNTSSLYRPGGVRAVITANPLNVEHFLKNHFENYPKGERFVNHLKDFLGQGIFNSDGDIWKIQRKTASYEFNTKSLRNFVMENVTLELQERMIPLLKDACESDRVLDMQDILERFAFDNICKLAFNVDPGCLGGDGTSGGEFMHAFEEAADLSASRFRYALPVLWKVKRFLNMGSEKRLKKSIRIVHNFADKIIQSRLENRGKSIDEDLLSRFIGDRENSTESLRDIIISFILAGRDTTSSGLSWFLWQVSSRPDVVEKILEELEAIRAKYKKSFGEAYSFDELRDMHYLHAAISESLRLYPPVPTNSRASEIDDFLPDGTFIGKNWSLVYHPYAMGRMESIWGKNCCEFLPERWLENGVFKQESPYKFPVFHAGPRMCLGKELAYIQMKSIAASVLERFKIILENSDNCPVHSLSLTLRMKGGLHVKVHERGEDN